MTDAKLLLAIDVLFPPPSTNRVTRASLDSNATIKKRTRPNLRPVQHVLYEPIDRQLALRLMEELDEEDAGERAKLSKLLSQSTGAADQCVLKVQYRKKNDRDLGRVHADNALSLGSLRRDLRAKLCRERLFDLDMVNAHPTLALHFARKVACLPKRRYAYLESYVQHRESYLQKLEPKCRATAKRLVLAIMFGQRAQESYANNEHYTGLRQNVAAVKRAVQAHAPEFASLARANGRSNIAGSAFAFYLGQKEYEVLNAALAFLQSRNWRPATLLSDGLFVYKKQDTVFTEQNARELSEHVLDTTGIPIVFCVKQWPEEK